MARDTIRSRTSSAATTTNRETVRKLAELFQAFGPLYKRWLHRRLASELGTRHHRAVGELGHHGPMVMSALGVELGVTPRYVTAIVDALEREGLARRVPHAVDRRATVVELTERGQQAYVHGAALFNRLHEELLEVLTPVQQARLLECLESLLAELRPSAATCEPERRERR